MYKNKKFDLYLLKNTICSILPALIILVVIMISVLRFNILDRIIFEYAGGTEALQALYDKHAYGVDMKIDRADYMGYDYYQDDETAGRYYYSFIDGKCVVFLIDSREDVILDYNFRGVIKYDTALYQFILSQCAAEMGISIEQLEASSMKFAVSEVDYPKLFYQLVTIGMLVVLCIIVMTIVEGIYRIIFPWKTPSVKSINGVANGRLVVKDINMQLRENTLLVQKNIIVTEKYLIAPSVFRTDVILIDNIEVLSKHMERKRTLTSTKDVYKLIISDSEDMFYEQEFASEEMIDEIIPLLEKSKDDINRNC